jgi:hypothetical protein
MKTLCLGKDVGDVRGLVIIKPNNTPDGRDLRHRYLPLAEGASL